MCPKAHANRHGLGDSPDRVERCRLAWRVLLYPRLVHADTAIGTKVGLWLQPRNPESHGNVPESNGAPWAADHPVHGKGPGAEHENSKPRDCGLNLPGGREPYDREKEPTANSDGHAPSDAALEEVANRFIHVPRCYRDPGAGAM